ncbi:MAG: antitoxin [Nitrosomonas sp.]|nr:antitoxin [Nitrosomonas sp.]
MINNVGRKKMSRLSIDLTPEQHQKIKAIAAMQGKSIKEYVLNQILPTSSDEEMALHELEALLDERVKSTKAGKISQKSVKEIFQEVYSESAK